MLRYDKVFIRGLIVIWLATWVFADPLFLVQELIAPEEYSPAYRVIRNAPTGKHVTPHSVDARISSSTEGNPNRGEDIQSDHSGFGSPFDLRQFDRARPVVLMVVFQHWLLFSTAAASRAPPILSL